MYGKDKPARDFFEKSVGSGMFALRAVSSKSAEAGEAPGEEFFEGKILNRWTNVTDIHHILEGLEPFCCERYLCRGKVRRSHKFL